MSAERLPLSDATEILMERIEYLIEHHNNCHLDCEECLRFAKIRHQALGPFDSNVRYTAVEERKQGIFY